jgi:catechol 2,3-dioxygenase-like lactoylglutathione lyase family enzyme
MRMQLTFDQVHLGVPDPLAAADWYRKHLGATPGDHVDRVMFGDTRFIFLKNERPEPSHGAAIDHVSLSYADLTAQLGALEQSGMRVRSDGFIEDPWGAKIELIEDREAVGLHHVHLRVPDPAAARTWYSEMLGASPGQVKGLDGLDCAGMWLTLEEGPATPSRGHTIDHIGYRVPDLMDTAAALKGKGLGFTTEPQPGPTGPHAPVLLSFVEDPWGVKIELLQRR